MDARERLIEIFEENHTANNLADAILKEFVSKFGVALMLEEITSKIVEAKKLIPVKDAPKYCRVAVDSNRAIWADHYVELKPEYQEKKDDKAI